MSTSLLVLKVLAPTLAKGLLESFNIQSKLTNNIAKKAIDTAASELLKPAANKADLSQQAEEIAKRMADDIRPLFEGQDRQVSISSREPIVWGLAQTLTKAGLTQAGLAEMNFDAGSLEKHLLEANPGVDRDFSEGEQALYQRAVGMMSQRLIEAAPSVEGYEVAKATEVLQRLEEITKQLGVERDLAIQAADEFVERYRRVVKDELDRLEVFGLPRMDRLTSKQSLSMAYITLSASGFVYEDGDDDISVALEMDYRRKDGKEEGKTRRILSQVDEAMCDCRRLVIRGGAGAGGGAGGVGDRADGGDWRGAGGDQRDGAGDAV